MFSKKFECISSNWFMQWDIRASCSNSYEVINVDFIIFGFWEVVFIFKDSLFEAIIEGCKKAEELAILEQDSECEFYKNIYVYSDSAYIINCYSQKWWVNWEKNGWINSKKQKVANRELWESLIYYFKKPNFYFKKVPGHSNNKWNNYVDKLAVQAKFDF